MVSKYIENIIQAVYEKMGAEVLVLDQMISPVYYKYFLNYSEGVQLLHVRRNPKDQAVDLKPNLRRMVRTKISLGIDAAGVCLSSKHLSTDIFIKDTRLNINRADECSRLIDSYHVFCFEELVNNYPKSVIELYGILNIDHSDVNWSSLDIEFSKSNIGKWKKLV